MEKEVDTVALDPFRLIPRGNCADIGFQLKNSLESIAAVLSWILGSSKSCRPNLLTPGFSRVRTMMIGNERTGGTGLYCRLMRYRMVLR